MLAYFCSFLVRGVALLYLRCNGGLSSEYCKELKTMAVNRRSWNVRLYDLVMFVPIRIWQLLLGHLRLLLIISGISSLLLFTFWLTIVFLWTIEDAERGRKTISFSIDQEVVIDYPLRFLAEDVSQAVHLTADSQVPISVTIEISGDVPLFMTSAIPIGSVTVLGGQSDQLVVTWPLGANTVVSPVCL